MKRVLLSMAVMLIAGFASAQYYTINYINAGQNPGNLNNDDEQPSAWLAANLSGYSDILTSGASGWSATQSIPFSFEFNGGGVTSYHAAAAGVVSFASVLDTIPSITTNAALPTAGVPDSSICAWGLSLVGPNDGVVTKTFGTSPNRQHWIIWASASGPGVTSWAYWGVVLEETTNKIYVVDMRTYGGNVSLSMGIQIDESNSVNIGSAVQSQNTATGGASMVTDNTYYSFNPGVQPVNDLENVSVDNSPYLEVNTSGTVTGTVRNLGSATVTEFEIEYAVDGSTAVNGSITGVSIASGATYSYNHPTSWTPTTEQLSTIETSVVSVNSSTDEDSSNDDASTDVLVHPTPVPRKPLLEQFTSSTCPPCTPGNQNVLSILSAYPGEYSKVNYQMSWPGTGDPYYTLEGGDRRTFYGVNSVPSMHTDGSLGLNSNSYTSAIFEAAQEVPAFVNLAITATVQPEFEYEVKNGKLKAIDSMYNLSAAVGINPVVDMPAGLVAFMSVQENLTFNNIKTNGETEFHDVMKKMLPNSQGSALSAITANDSITVSETHTFPGAYRLSNDAGDPIDHTIEHSVEEWDDLSLAAWVQNTTTGEIWQSENVEIEMLDEISNVEEEVVGGVTVYTVDGVQYVMMDGTLVPNGINENTAEMIAVYPNPASDVISIKGVSGITTVSIYDASGRLVKKESVSNNRMDVSSLTPAVYNVSIENNGVQKIERISIVK